MPGTVLAYKEATGNKFSVLALSKYVIETRGSQSEALLPPGTLGLNRSHFGLSRPEASNRLMPAVLLRIIQSTGQPSTSRNDLPGLVTGGVVEKV